MARLFSCISVCFAYYPDESVYERGTSAPAVVDGMVLV